MAIIRATIVSSDGRTPLTEVELESSTLSSSVVMFPQPLPEPPRPLMRELASPEPFPVNALGVLADAALAINDKIQCPPALAAQSILAVAALATQGFANIELPTHQIKPISDYFLTVAETGERKSASDDEALEPIKQREAALREEYDNKFPRYQNAMDAWEAARKYAITQGKGNVIAITQALERLGPPPVAPLTPLLTCPEPTYEGLVRLLKSGHPSVGVFSGEGGQFIGSHGMNTDAKLRTAAGMSAFWDGGVIKRVRSGDGITILPGRRVAVHLMAQPDVANIMLSDLLLLNQGLISRCLVSAPEPTSGTRLWRNAKPESDAALVLYNQRMGRILEASLPVAEGKLNELMPRRLPLSGEAEKMWIGFVDSVERRIARGGELEAVRGLANKLPEHAARLAAILALAEDINIWEISAANMDAGITLAEHYATEALRLFDAGYINPDLRLAARLLEWLLTSWDEKLISLPDIYQRGPNAIRDKAIATKIVRILEDHRHITRVPGGGIVAGTTRKEAWLIVEKSQD